MQGRLKSIYSIYKKMIRKKIPVRQVYDARALRIIVDDEGGSRTGDAWAAAYRWAPLQDGEVRLGTPACCEGGSVPTLRLHLGIKLCGLQ